MYLIEGGQVRHDSKLRGEFSKTLYQIDVHHQSDNGEKTTMGEAKDYSDRGAKVGRGDIQKIAGALPDLPSVKSGAFFSATGFTSPARKYAQASELLTGGKEIALYNIHPSSEKDDNGFIKKIILTIHFDIPNPQQGNFKPILTNNSVKLLQDIFLKNGKTEFSHPLGLSEFYNSEGNTILSLAELTASGYGDTNEEDNTSHGCYLLPKHHIKINEILAELHGLEYHIPHEYVTREITISDDSENRFTVKDGDGKALLILTDKRLRSFSFDENGNLIKPDDFMPT